MTGKIIPSANGLEIIVKDGKPLGCRLGNIQSLDHAGEVLTSLYDSSEAMPFIVGDLCNAMRDKFEHWEQVLPEFGSIAAQKQLKTLQNWSSICDRLPHDIRRIELSFSHHAEVAYIEDLSVKRDLLDWAVSYDATVKELREERARRIHPDNERLQLLERVIHDIIELTDSDDDSAAVLAIRRVCREVIK